MIFNLSDKPSIAHEFIHQMRDVEQQHDAARFRNNLRRIGQVLAYEISKKLNYDEVEVETPLGVANCATLKDQLVLATILRAGLPIHDGLLSYFGNAQNAFIASYRRHHKDGTFEIAMEYATFPKIKNKVLILADAMIATGSSIEKAYEVLTDDGHPESIHIVCAIASNQGIDRLRRIYPGAKIWTGAIDDELTAKSYVVPGLGDAGDLAYGMKGQD